MSINVIISGLTVFLLLILGIFVLLDNYRQKRNVMFFLLCLIISFWIGSNIFAVTTSSYIIALFFTRISIIWTACLPIFFNELLVNIFFYKDINKIKEYRIVLFIAIIITLIITFLSQTSFNVKQISIQEWGVDFKPGFSYYILFFYLLTTFGFSFLNLYRISKISSDPQKTQAKLILTGSFITLILSISMDIVLPIAGYSFMSIFAPPTAIIFIIFIGIAISRHRLFNIKVITVELITCGLWIFMFTRTLLAKTPNEVFINGSVFLVTVVIGVLLIKSVLTEIDHREKLEVLTSDLKNAYDQIKKLSMEN